MEVSTRAVTFDSRLDDGLHAVIQLAAKAVASDEFDSGGMLAITPVEALHGASLRMEAALSDDGLRRAIAQLDVHLNLDGARVDPAVVGEAVAAFGGTAYTNLCVAAQPEDGAAESTAVVRPLPDDALDVTITQPGSLPFYARNSAQLRETLSPAEQEAAIASLTALGVWHRRRGSGVAVSTHQFRARVTTNDQARALLEVVERELSASLFTARIPPAQSLRIAYQWGPKREERRARVEVCISHGLIAERATTVDEVLAIQRFAERHFAFAPAARQWRVERRDGR